MNESAHGYYQVLSKVDNQGGLSFPRASDVFQVVSGCFCVSVQESEAWGKKGGASLAVQRLGLGASTGGANL